MTDELTGIANRRDFLNKLGQYMAISRRNSTPLCILSMDIDYFKNINDTYGHDVGDGAIVLFCNTVSKHLRKSDIFGRMGGEEFSIALQNTSKDGALIWAENIRRNIQETPYILKNTQEVRITVSIGIAEYKAPNDTIDELLKRGDLALYQAKEKGRNCVVFFETEEKK